MLRKSIKVQSHCSLKLRNYRRRQYVHRFHSWGWKKYQNNATKRSAQSLQTSAQGDEEEEDEEENEDDEPDRAAAELGQATQAQNTTSASSAKRTSEGCSKISQSVRSPSHGYPARASQGDVLPPFDREIPVVTPPVAIRPKRSLHATREGHLSDQAEVLPNPEVEGVARQMQNQSSQLDVEKGSQGFPEDLTDDLEDLEDQPRLKRLRVSRGSMKLGCPFRRRNPRKFNVREYGSCALNGFADLALLKCAPRHFFQCCVSNQLT